VEVNHRPAPCGLVQPIHVLGEQDLALAIGFEARQGVIRIVGQGLSESSPADHAARPVTTTRGFLGDEGLEAHRLRPFPVAVDVAIVGDSGVRAAAGAGQNEKALMAFDEGLECARFLA